MDNQPNCVRLFINNILSCVYLPLIVMYLKYTDKLYSLGKDHTHIEWILILFELIKYYLCHLRPDKNMKKTIPVKKFEFNNLLSSVFVLASVIITFYITAILFGAPLLSKQFETLSFAVTLTALTALPCCLHLGKDSVLLLFTSLLEFEGNDTCQRFLLNIRLTLFGAWLGAVLIPLDWNRPYQEWPIPCSSGAIVGCFLANLVLLLPSKYLMRRRKINRFNL